jgi:hypothetical protein
VSWRIYRLPGSKEWWLIDTGDGTALVYTKSFEFTSIPRAVDRAGTASPRAWLETETEPMIVGVHSHKCSCGHEWSHGDEMKNNKEAHTCPVCHQVLPGRWEQSSRSPDLYIMWGPIRVAKVN